MKKLICAVLFVAGCVALKADTKLFGSAYVDCVKADLGQPVVVDGVTKPAGSAVGDALRGDGSAAETQLVTIGVQIGVDAFECAVTAAECVQGSAGDCPSQAALQKAQQVAAKLRVGSAS